MKSGLAPLLMAAATIGTPALGTAQHLPPLTTSLSYQLTSGSYGARTGATDSLAQARLVRPPSSSPAVADLTDLWIVGSAAVVYLVPPVFGIKIDGPATCAPCDQSSVPFFDRWAIQEGFQGWSTASDVVRGGLAVLTWADLLREGRQGAPEFVASLESMMWGEGVVRLLKRVVGRNRPILYTEEGVLVADQAAYQRSWPSGHSSSAAAIATSYWLSRRRLDRSKTDIRPWLIAVGALGVAALRVGAAKHFPSDVVSGLAIGAGAAAAIHAIKF